MLSSDHRLLLLEHLRPPDGYRVDRIVATTFTLNHVALLSAPLAFSVFGLDASAPDGEGPSGLALLQSLREYAEKMVVFCQTARASVPQRHENMLIYLERSVVEVRPKQGVFHPKLWLLRLLPQDPNGTVRYRVLVSTRNITFDQSWDTMLTLEGDVRGRTHRESVPLSDFVRHLPTLAVRELDARARRDVELVAEEVRTIAFEMPEGVEAMRFWPMGIDGYRAFPLAERADRRLIISPFLTKAQIAAFELRADDVLISRRDQLDRIPAEILAGVRACVINDAALPEDETEDDVGGPLLGARGLHAKLYVHDAGWQAHLWTGSANATSAGFHRNVEFLVQLTGKRSKLGVDAILGKEKGALEHLLTPHKIQAFASDVEAAEEAMEAALESCVEAILAAEPNVRLSERGPDRFELVLAFARQLFLDGATVRAVRCWPVTLPYPRGVALALSGVPRVSFGEVSLGAVTSFFAFEARVVVGNTSGQRQFSLNLPIHGAPEDRFAKHLASLLKNDEGLLRFLLQLLATHEFDLSELEQDRRYRGGGGSAVAPSREPIYELLVRSLHQNPERLKDVKRVLDELRGTPGAERIVTPELDAVCAALFEAAGLETKHV